VFVGWNEYYESILVQMGSEERPAPRRCKSPARLRKLNQAGPSLYGAIEETAHMRNYLGFELMYS